MPQLMNHDDFRTALENAIKGKSANKAPFSIAWASGKLSRAHLARWAENHFHYVGPFADYLGYVYARMPAHYQEAKDFLLANMYEEEIGGDRHTDLLIRFAEACGTTGARAPRAAVGQPRCGLVSISQSGLGLYQFTLTRRHGRFGVVKRRERNIRGDIVVEKRCGIEQAHLRADFADL